MKNGQVWRRIGSYLCGLFLLALGLTLNAKCDLGVSPLIAVPYTLSLLWGWNYGNLVFVWYGVYILVEMTLHFHLRGEEKQKILMVDLLQFPLSLVFSRILNLFSGRIPVFSLYYGIPGRALILCGAILITGFGAAMTLRARLIPNPGDGVVQTIADARGKKLGSCKNAFDIANVVIAAGISCFWIGKICGVGVGTVLAMLGTGRAIALYNRLTQKKCGAELA